MNAVPGHCGPVASGRTLGEDFEGGGPDGVVVAL